MNKTLQVLVQEKPLSFLLLSLSFFFFFCEKWTSQTHIRLQTPSLTIRSFLSNSARCGYATKGTPPKSSAHLSTETSPSLLFVIFPDQSLSSNCFKCSLIQWFEISCVSHGLSCLTKRRSLLSVILMAKGEPSSAYLIA